MPNTYNRTFPQQMLPGVGGVGDRISALELATLADEAAFQGVNPPGTVCDLLTTALLTPANVAVAQGPLATAGSTSYTYVVADVGNAGTFAPASGVALTTGNATLSATNCNVITWSAIIGHTYNVYRSASSGTPSGTGLIGSFVATSGAGTFTDTGITATGNTPTANDTGALAPVGPIFGSSVSFIGANVPTLNNANNQTLTIAHLSNGLLERLGAGTVTDTLPTAVALVAAFPGAKNNTGFFWSYRNHTGNNATLAVGNGGNNATGNTLVVGSAKAALFQVVLTNVTPGNEAYVLYSLGASAY